MAEIPSKQPRSYRTPVNNRKQYYSFSKPNFSYIHVDGYKSWYTNNVGVILPVYQYRKFLIPNNSSQPIGIDCYI